MLCVAIYIFQAIANLYDDRIKRKHYDYGNLPPHITARILSHLSTDDFRHASQVCKSWYYASSDPRVLKNIVVSFGIISTKCDYLVRPIYNARFDMVNFNNLHYRNILRNFGRQIIDIEINSKITFNQLFELFIYLPNVQSFRIADSSKYVSLGNFHRSKKITKYKDVIVRNLAKIKQIEIWTEVRNLELYRLFLSYCSNVESFHWGDSENVAHGHGEFLFNYLLNKTANPILYKVTDLKLDNLDRKQNSKFFEQMVKLELRNIKKLALSEISSSYYDTMYREFCKTYNFLDSFTVRGCSADQLTDICKYMTNLKSLTLYSCTANNMSELLHLKHIDELHIERVDVVVHDDLVVLFSSGHKLLKKLQLNDIDDNLLKLICENCKNLTDLSLEDVHTKNCEPIFRNLVKLKKLNIVFTESTNMNSSRIRSSDRYNITNLTQLEEVYVSSYVPGITPELIQKLPKIRKGWEYTWDPTDEDLSLNWVDLLLDLEIAENIINNDRRLADDSDETSLDYNISDFDWCQELIL